MNGIQRLILLAALLAVAACILFIPLRILAYGYLPPDDALRHAAKAVSGKPWSEILVLGDDIVMDSHPGWHAFLGAVHRVTGWNAETLAAASIAILFWVFCLLPVFLLRRPEAWLAALLIILITLPYFTTRLVMGRPVLLTMAAVCLLGLRWRSLTQDHMPRGTMILLTAMFGIATWMHCAWYLFALPIGAFCLARRWRAARRLALAAAAGVILGTLATGSPIDFLRQTFTWPLRALGGEHLQRNLVSEFRPIDGDFPIILVTFALLLWRKVRGAWKQECVDNPVFILAAAAWVLGFISGRFWYDLGIPSLLAWTALEMQDTVTDSIPGRPLKRLALAAAAGIILLLATTSDVHGRWTNNLTKEYLDAGNPALAGWMPEPGGILYSDSLIVFYDTFFTNPNAPWRYMVGFEPAMMPPEDLAVFRNIQFNYGAGAAFHPWVDRMTPADRLILRRGPGRRPNIPELDWRYAAARTWIGRPVNNADTNPKPAEGDTP